MPIEIFITPSYLIYAARGLLFIGIFEIFNLPAAETEQSRSDEAPRVLRLDRPSITGQIPLQLREIWHIHERSASTLFVVGAACGETSSQIVLLKCFLHPTLPLSISKTDIHVCDGFYHNLRAQIISPSAQPLSQSLLVLASFKPTPPVRRPIHCLIRVAFNVDPAEAFTVTMLEDTGQEFDPYFAQLSYHWIDKLKGRVGIICTRPSLTRMFIVKTVAPPTLVGSYMQKSSQPDEPGESSLLL
jgi:hypothetical protein